MGHICFLWKVKVVEEIQFDNRVKLQKKIGVGGGFIKEKARVSYHKDFCLDFHAVTHPCILTAAMKYLCPGSNATDSQPLSFFPYDSIILFALLNLAFM